MTAWNPRANELFLKALEIHSPGERREYLDGACAGDSALRAEVESLLDASVRAGSFLEGSPAANLDSSAAHPTAEAPGTVIGPYKLVELIADGGMGRVWMTQQSEPVKRLVALKVIRAGMDSKQVLARFDAERQALALMDHPNIAKVFDAGAAPDGRPFFVMELVKGVPITKFCDDHRLTPRQRLELFVPICHAIQHAHQKGIIHRDVKPSNVLVALFDDKPVPKVIDFGVAKATGQQLTEQTLHTSFGAVVGTVEYMSPEQATFNQLDVDTRSDIYSLGVLLYELLTGSTPFTKNDLEKAGLLETLRVIREQEPTKPSTKLSTADGLPTLAANRGTEPAKLARIVRGELDWIVMKALEKDRSRRYETANGFAMDVQRYLADEPVLACPPSVVYRLQKFARRNKPGLTVAAALALMFVAAGAFAWYADRQAASRSEERHVRLGRNAEAVTALLDQCEEALSAEQPDRAAVALEAAERRAADGGAEGLADRLHRCRADLKLLRALDDVDTFSWTWTEDDRAADPKTLAVRWRAAFGDYGIVTDDNPAAAAERVNGSLIRDRALTALDEWLAAEPSASVREVLRSVDPDPYRDAVRDALAALDRSMAVTLTARPEALVQPARFAAVLGQLRGGQPERQRAVLERALRARPGALRLLMALGISYSTDARLGPREQVRWYQAAVAAHPGNVAAINNLGIALWKSGNRDGSIFYFKETIRLEPTFARGHFNLGVALRSKGDMRGARAAYQEAIRVKPDYVAAHFDLGLVSPTTDEAIAAYREAVRLDPMHRFGHFNLGWNLRRKGEADGALVAFREALRIDPESAPTHYELALLLASGPDRLLNGKQAVEHAKRACELTKWNDPVCIATLGAAHAEDGDFDKAIEYQKKALSFPDLKNAGPEWGQKRLDFYERRKPYRDPAFIPREPAPVPREVAR